MTDPRGHRRGGSDAPMQARRDPKSLPMHAGDVQLRAPREESHIGNADGSAREVIHFAARTRRHIAYARGLGGGDPNVARGDTLLSARTWKNEFR